MSRVVPACRRALGLCRSVVAAPFPRRCDAYYSAAAPLAAPGALASAADRAVDSAARPTRRAPHAPDPTPDPAWLGLRRDVVAALVEAGIARPTDIQAAAIPAVLAGESVLLAGGTGTGKTLAYLLPLAHRLKAEEAAGGGTRRQRPRALVLVPTRELALQVLAVAKRLCHTAKLRASAVVGGTPQGAQRRTLDTDVDLVVATPGRLLLLLEQRWLSLTDVRAVVIDEVDTMLSDRDGFGADVTAVLAPLLRRGDAAAAAAAAAAGAAATAAPASGREAAARPPPRRVQLVLAGATVPRAAQRAIEHAFPGVRTLAARGVHLPPPALAHRFVRVGAEADAKHEALRRVLGALPGGPTPVTGDAPRGGGGSVLVFCNTVPSARSTAHFLSEAGYPVASLHGGIPPLLRAAEFAAFVGGGARVLVCTDAAARGLDFPALEHAVLFDFPLAPVEYLHRAGRVARAGRPGTVTSLVAKRDVVLARGIQAAAEAGTPLTDVSATAAPEVAGVVGDSQRRVVGARRRATGGAPVDVAPRRWVPPELSRLRRRPAAAAYTGRSSSGGNSSGARAPGRSTSAAAFGRAPARSWSGRGHERGAPTHDGGSRGPPRSVAAARPDRRGVSGGYSRPAGQGGSSQTGWQPGRHASAL